MELAANWQRDGCHFMAQVDPTLLKIAKAWPGLPTHIRLAIDALVRGAK